MAVRVRVAGSGTLVAWKVPWPDVFLTEERLLSAVASLGDMVGHARSYYTCQSSHGGKLTRPQLHVKSWVWRLRNSPPSLPASSRAPRGAASPWPSCGRRRGGGERVGAPARPA